MKTRHYLLIAFFAYLFFLIATLPAKPVIDFLTEKQNNIEIEVVTGTLWNGQAGQVSIDGIYNFSQVKWNTIFWRLLTGELAAEIDANFEGQPSSAQAGISITGNISAQNIHAGIDTEVLADMVEIPLAELGGQIILKLDSLYWQPQQLPVANGTILWKQATITVAETVELGDATIKLSEDDNNGMDIVISNKGGNLKTDGQVKLNSDASYSLTLTLKPTGPDGQNLADSLAMFAKKQGNNSFLLKQEGKLELPQ